MTIHANVAVDEINLRGSSIQVYRYDYLYNFRSNLIFFVIFMPQNGGAQVIIRNTDLILLKTNPEEVIVYLIYLFYIYALQENVYMLHSAILRLSEIELFFYNSQAKLKEERMNSFHI